MADTSPPDRVVQIDVHLAEKSGRPDLIDRITALLEQIAGRMEGPQPLSQTIQQTLGELSEALPYLPRLKNADINVAQAELAVRALLSTNPDKDLANAIVRDLVRRKKVYDSSLKSILKGRTPVTFVLLGVAGHAVLLAISVYILSLWFPCEASDGAVCWEPMAIAGAVGGATSLLSRLGALAGLSRWSAEGDPRQLFYTGLLKPMIGIVAGLFAYAAISSGLIAVNVPTLGSSKMLYYAALAFLAGFSERFAQDLTESASNIRGA